MNQHLLQLESKYAGLKVNEANRLREREIENNTLKKLPAERVREVEAMQDLLSKKQWCILGSRMKDLVAQ